MSTVALVKPNDPLLDLRTLGFRTFTITLTLMCLSFMALMGVMITLPLFLDGGFFLTLPVAPADALLTDVVVAELRGRAAALRSMVRSAAGLMPILIGFLADRYSLQTAMLLVTPIYAAGGMIMLIAARFYPSDLAFVVAESGRLRGNDSKPDARVRMEPDA